MKMAVVFLMLSQCHEENGAQFNIVSVLLNIIFKHNLKTTVKLSGMLFCSMSGIRNLL